MSTDLPAVIDLFGTSYDFRYSESYGAVLTGDSNHSTDLVRAAFDSLLMYLNSWNYAAAIFNLHNGNQIFDSHSKDLLGMRYPLGTCKLVEIDSLNNLVQYFHTFHAQTTNVSYEAKDVSIHEMHRYGDN